jgi:hypothetical protein
MLAARLRILKVPQWLAVRLKEDVVMVDLSSRFKSGAKAKLPVQNDQCTRASAAVTLRASG